MGNDVGNGVDVADGDSAGVAVLRAVGVEVGIIGVGVLVSVDIGDGVLVGVGVAELTGIGVPIGETGGVIGGGVGTQAARRRVMKRITTDCL